MTASTAPSPSPNPPSRVAGDAPRSVLMPVLPLLLAAAAASGCSTVERALAGDKVDYRSTTVRAAPLDVPPDLSQLSKESRFQVLPGGGISAAGSTGPSAAVPPAVTGPIGPVAPGAAPAGAVAITPVVPTAPSAAGAPLSPSAGATAPVARIERAGDQRWLVSSLPPEQLWPRLRAFWTERGFAFTTEQADLGLLETDWAENRAMLPQDLIRRTLGRVFDSFYSTGERDRFRTRIERTPTGSEVFISHRGVSEVYTDAQRTNTVWQPRPSNPELEAEFLLRLAGVLNGTDPGATAAGPTATAAPAAAAAPVGPARARLTDAAGTPALQVDDGFDRAWRRVGLALDRNGFTVEDRDRAAGVYAVRFVPLNAQKAEEKGFFGRLFSSEGSSRGANDPQRLRVTVKGESDARSVVTVQNSQGAAPAGDSAQRVLGLLLDDLK